MSRLVSDRPIYGYPGHGLNGIIDALHRASSRTSARRSAGSAWIATRWSTAIAITRR
jgi:hypothetical protein